MGTYYIPRNTKGEGRILFVFSQKALIYTLITGGVGLIFYFVFSLLGMKLVGIGITVFFALIGFIIGTFKMPEIKKFEFSKKTGGETLDDILRRAIKFKMKNKGKIYVYKEENDNVKQ